jgi:N-acetylmuramic acid 6-phosphate (MurNAc-6-P) etherase
MKQKQIVLLVVFVVLAAVLAGTAPYANGALDSAKKLDGKAIFEAKCLKCHKLAKFKEQQNSRKEWVLILSRMQRGTCDINDNELEALADYLAKTYGD